MKPFIIQRNERTFNEEAFLAFQKDGYVILQQFLSDEELHQIKNKIEFLSEFESSNKIAHFYGESLQRIWNLLNKDLLFHELLLSEQVDLWMNRIFARETNHQKYFLSSFQANILMPGAREQILHIDTPFPEPIPPYPIKANTIWLLDDFTEINGATEIIPGSHISSKRPPRSPSEYELKKIEKVIAPKGSVLITSGNLWHRSGNNKSSNNRTVLLGSFAASYIREIACEDDTVRFLSPNMRNIMNPKLIEIIGANHGSKPGNNYE